MREKTIEAALVKATKAHGGIAPKFVSPGMAGMPDRLVIMPMGRIAFVELKAPGKKPRPLQVARHELLRSLGVDVYVVDDMAQVVSCIKKIGGEENEF